MSDELTLIAGVHRQNTQILQELAALKRQIESIQAPPPELWVNGFDRLHEALKQQGLEVSHVRLKGFRNCEVFREGEECRNFGTPKKPRWRFHVEKCRAAIAQSSVVIRKQSIVAMAEKLPTGRGRWEKFMATQEYW